MYKDKNVKVNLEKLVHTIRSLSGLSEAFLEAVEECKSYDEIQSEIKSSHELKEAIENADDYIKEIHKENRINFK